MATTTTPNLSLTLAVPGTNEPFDTDAVNTNFTAIDTFAGVQVAADAAQSNRLDVIEKFTNPQASSATVGVVPSGTTAQRDGFWGTPADAAARVALANKAARWFNTDTNFGFDQRYFAPTSDSATTGYLAQNARGGGGWLPACPYERASTMKTSGTVVVPITQTMMLALPATITSGGKIRITVVAQWVNPSSNLDRVVAAVLLCDGAAVPVAHTQTIVPFINGASTGSPTIYVWEHTPAAGSHNYEFHAQAGVANSVSFAPNSNMKVEEVAA